MQEGASLVFDKIQATMEVWNEYLQKTGADPNITKPIPEDENEGFTSLDHGAPPIPKLP